MSILSTYQELSQATSQWPRGSADYRGEQHRRYAAMSLVGETGEVVDALKKKLAGQDVPREKLLLELGDVAWSIACVCEIEEVAFEDLLLAVAHIAGQDTYGRALWLARYATCAATCLDSGKLAGFPLLYDVAVYFVAVVRALDMRIEDVLAANLQKLSKRYPSGTYSHQDSIARRDVKEVTPC